MKIPSSSTHSPVVDVQTREDCDTPEEPLSWSQANVDVQTREDCDFIGENVEIKVA